MSPKDIEKLKQKIYSHLEESDDKTAMEMLQEAVAVYSSSTEKDIIDELTPDQKKRLEDSILKAKEGKVVRHEEAMQRIKGWLWQ